jgi:hypothetical protein
MDYPQTLQKAQTLLDQRHYAQAVQTATNCLEQLLEDLYQELLRRATPARQRELADALERVGGGQPLHQLTLGQKMGAFRVSDAHKDLEKLLDTPLTYFSTQNLEPLRQLRNRVVHQGYQPDRAEAAYVVNQVAVILRETGRLPEEAGPVRDVLAPWWQTAMPHRDIRQGRLDLKVFAVDLAQVVEGGAVPEYQDAETFFRRTYLTQGLRATLKGVLRRLAGQENGIAITQMATVFGGGKTHTLLALYHVVEHSAQVAHMAPIRQLLHEAELEGIPQARVAAIDCAHLSLSEPRVTPEGLTLHTLWGELAYRLGAPDRGPELYEIVRNSDEGRVAPGGEALQRLFAAAGPSLVLLDETLSYITKASAIPVGRGYLSDQAQEFLLELTRAVNAADDAALVITMTASKQEQIGEAAMRAAREIDTATRIMRRTRQVEVSAEREELYEILKRRLFDTPAEQLEAQARSVAEAYWDYYRAHPNDFPQEVQAPEYRHLMVRAYPFHPALIEILRDRWGSISGFQRTRGVLRLLALVIEDLYRRQHSAPLIQPAHVNLDNGEIRAELLEYVDQRGGYESAIFSDIGGTPESKAPYLDHQTGGDYGRYHIATGLATAIFMYSHSGATQRTTAAERPQLWLATLRPEIVPALAADALDKLRRRLWYLDVEEGSYRISSQPNLNQMLVTRRDAIRQDHEAVRQRLRQAVEEVAGRRPFPAINLWPGEPREVNDQRTLTLVVLAPRWAWPQGAALDAETEAREFIHRLLAQAVTPRQYKNSLAFVLPTEQGVRNMEDAAVNLLALEAIDRQYSAGGLSETQADELRRQLDQASKGLPGAVWGAYTLVVAPNGEAGGKTELWVRQEYGIIGYRPGEHSLARRVWQRLVDDQRLLARLDPRLISEGKGDQWRLWPADVDRLNVAQLWDYFCRFPYLPLLTGPEALQETLTWGVQRGLFAYALGDGEEFDTIYYQESLPSGQFQIIEGAWLLRPELAERLLRPEEEEPVPEPEPPPSGEVTPPTPGPRPPRPRPEPVPPPRTYRRVVIDTPLDWQRWYEFHQAVIEPLIQAGAEVEIQLHLEAGGELDADLIDLSVRESVVQLDSQGEVETEE